MNGSHLVTGKRGAVAGSGDTALLARGGRTAEPSADLLSYEYLRTSREDIETLSRTPDGRRALAVIAELAHDIEIGKTVHGVSKEKSREYLRDVLELIANPKKLNQGGDITCTEVAVFSEVLTSNKTLAARMAKDLLTSGTTTLPGGKQLFMNADDVNGSDPSRQQLEGFEPRTTGERALQASMFRGFSSLITYTNRSGVVVQEVGTSLRELKNMAEQFFGRDAAVLATDESKERYLSAQNGPVRGALAVVGWTAHGKDETHCLRIVNVTRDRNGNPIEVEFFHGWGQLGQGGPADRTRNEATGTETMSYQNFLKITQFLVVDKGQAAALDLHCEMEDALKARGVPDLPIRVLTPELQPKSETKREERDYSSERAGTVSENAGTVSQYVGNVGLISKTDKGEVKSVAAVAAAPGKKVRTNEDILLEIMNEKVSSTKV